MVHRWGAAARGPNNRKLKIFLRTLIDIIDQREKYRRVSPLKSVSTW
jgi:hypothetical protein